MKLLHLYNTYVTMIQFNARVSSAALTLKRFETHIYLSSRFSISRYIPALSCS